MASASTPSGETEQPRKRGVGATSEASITRDELSELLDDFRQSVNTEVKSSIQAVEATITNKVDLLVRGANQISEKRIARVQDDVDNLAQAQRRTEKDVAELQQTVKEVRQSLAMAEKQEVTQRDLDTDDYARDPLLHVLKVGTEEAVPRENIKSVVDEWLAGQHVSTEHYVFSGPNLGTRFTLSFNGANGLGARRAKKANFSMRREDGSWDNLSTKSAGAANVKVYISPDKSPQAITKERMGKKLVRAFAEVHPGIKVFFQKKSGVLTSNYKPLATMVSDSADDERVGWNSALVVESEINKERIMEAFFSNARSAAPVQWSF